MSSVLAQLIRDLLHLEDDQANRRKVSKKGHGYSVVKGRTD
jgi:hypothetical protein